MSDKIAKITIYFWILKILATTLGETTGDMLSMTLNLGYAASLLLTGVILATLLAFQIKASKFHSVLFWACIIGTTTVGTEISDFMDRSLGLGYFGGALLLIAALMGTLGWWYASEKSLRVDSIATPGVEMKFWLAVLLSNSLGTAFGDYLTDDAALSYLQGALVTSAVIAVVLVLHFATRVNEVALFWIAFIFTRPFGATFGDWLTKPTEHGGLDLGTVQASFVTLVIFSVVLALSHRRRIAE